MNAENFDPIILEVELVCLRGDLHRVLRQRGSGEQQDGRQEADEWHCVFFLRKSVCSPAFRRNYELRFSLFQ
jgi:hypothetical protein